LRTQLEEIKREKKNHDKILLDDVIINKNLTSKHYFKLIRRLEQPRKIRFFERWRINYKYKIKLTSTNIDDLLYNAENLFYVKSISEIQEQLNKYKTFLDNSNKESIELELKKISRDLLVNKIQNHYENVEITGFNKDSYKNDYNNFILRYPVVLSTSQSLLNNAPNGFLFDYLIIDEASQCDLLSSVLAMSCSKNIVVVGDSRQLQQIDEERLFFQSQKLAKDFDIPTQYTYEANSILRSVKEAVVAVPTTLLKEHYRCAPDIINFCNKMFYNNELVAMTNNTGKHIEIIKTVPGNHARKNPYGSGLYNQREIDEINNIIQKANSKNIGVITPFRYQANLIQNKYKDTNLEADTIHKFQGRQKDEIIMSFVVNSLDNDPNNVENKLYDFVTNDKLLNVAISRGKSKVTIIVSDKLYHTKNNIIKDFIEYSEYLYGSSVTKESTVKSIFDYLYSEYNKDFISKYNEKPKKYQSELLMCSLIDKVLIDHHFIGYSMHVRLGKLVNILDIFNEEEKKYILHPWTHVDFLFYNKVTKKSLFVIEVDGIRYHEQKKKQVVHDKIKDRVLAMNNIPVFRFKTNESNEKERLKEIIHQYTY
jgi:superfamily I DNA and/or RNA helicase